MGYCNCRQWRFPREIHLAVFEMYLPEIHRWTMECSLKFSHYNWGLRLMFRKTIFLPVAGVQCCIWLQSDTMSKVWSRTCCSVKAVVFSCEAMLLSGFDQYYANLVWVLCCLRIARQNGQGHYGLHRIRKEHSYCQGERRVHWTLDAPSETLRPFS